MSTWATLATWASWASWPMTPASAGVTWGDLDLWGDLETWFDPSGTYTPPTVADLSPVALAAPTITPLSRVPSTMLPLESVSAHVGLGPGGASREPSSVSLAPESLASSSRLVSIVAVSSAVSGVSVLLAPAASLPTEGIPIFVGATEPDYVGEALWIVTLDPLDIRYQEG